MNAERSPITALSSVPDPRWQSDPDRRLGDPLFKAEELECELWR
jgi:hypothetical protein